MGQRAAWPGAATERLVLFLEANPDGLAIIPTPMPGERCHTAGLSVELVGVDAGAGNLVGTFRFRNNLDVDCTLRVSRRATRWTRVADPKADDGGARRRLFRERSAAQHARRRAARRGAAPHSLGAGAGWQRNNVLHGQQHRHHPAR